MKFIYKTIGLGLNLSTLVAPHWATQKSVELFSRPEKPNIRLKEQEFLNTAKQIMTKRNGYDIMEYHWGDDNAPLVFLSYGWSYNAGRWRHFVGDLLANGFRVIAYDPIGHGYSSKGLLDLPTNAGLIRDIITEQGGAHALIAHSFGGASSVYAVSQLPRHLQPKTMVLMASFSHAPRVFKGYRDAAGLWQLTYRRFVNAFEQRINMSLKAFDMAQMTADFRHIQSLIVHSPHDKITKFYSAMRYHSYWPGSYLFAPEDGGHHLGTTEITKSILNFIVYRQVPSSAEKQEQALDVNHELVRYFEGA